MRGEKRTLTGKWTDERIGEEGGQIEMKTSETMFACLNTAHTSRKDDIGATGRGRYQQKPQF